MNDFYVAWGKKEHAKLHEYRKYFPTFILAKVLENFNEIILLNEIKKERNEKFSLIDVGCATGEFYRYFSYRYPKVDYKGCDISEPAIENAKEKFPGVNFLVVDKNLSDLENGKVEVVFSRDVVVHNTNPFIFLKKLYDISSKYIILRLRTRDIGQSILDPEISCQLKDGSWVPFLVLNCEEIISEIKSFNPTPARIKFVKEYVVLGGQYNRYVPKELYHEETKTAVTALLIEKGNGATNCKIESYERKEGERYFIIGRILSEVIKLIVGSDYKGRTWW